MGQLGHTTCTTGAPEADSVSDILQIVEHGSFNDRERALEAVLQHAVEYSVDQYASKVIEKAIKSGDVVVLGKYLDSVMQAKTNDQARPRMPLIDIASDQYGNVS